MNVCWLGLHQVTMVMYQEANCLCDAKNPGLTLKLPEQAQILLRAIIIILIIIMSIIIIIRWLCTFF